MTLMWKLICGMAPRKENAACHSLSSMVTAQLVASACQNENRSGVVWGKCRRAQNVDPSPADSNLAAFARAVSDISSVIYGQQTAHTRISPILQEAGVCVDLCVQEISATSGKREGCVLCWVHVCLPLQQSEQSSSLLAIRCSNKVCFGQLEGTTRVICSDRQRQKCEEEERWSKKGTDGLWSQRILVDSVQLFKCKFREVVHMRWNNTKYFYKMCNTRIK